MIERYWCKCCGEEFYAMIPQENPIKEGCPICGGEKVSPLPEEI
jgi:predicted  nucleic acid-binding Zn-ribbon protein